MTPTKTEKLVALARQEFETTPEGLFEIIGIGTVVPGICMRPGCDYVTEVAGDEEDGWCDECETATCTSALLLAELV